MVLTMNIHELFQKAIAAHASDIHLREGEPPRMRVDGNLETVGTVALNRADITGFVFPFLTRHQIDSFELHRELDFSATLPGLCHTRVNLFQQLGRMCVSIRLIPDRIPTMDEIYLPRACRDFTNLTRGLVLVTGPTGSGKSTTLAAMIDAIARSRPVHILTIEDPVEFIFEQRKASVSQREVGRDTESFGNALHHAFRQNPDVVMLGEMRDPQSMGAAVTLAETGHLTFSTLHTVSAGQTINRIIDSFPPYQQDQIRSQLAITLEGVITQRLIPLKGRSGRVAAREVLVCTRAVKNIIRENKISQMQSAIQTGLDEGMVTMTRSLLHLIDQDLITIEAAMTVAIDRKELMDALGVSYKHRPRPAQPRQEGAEPERRGKPGTSSDL